MMYRQRWVYAALICMLAFTWPALGANGKLHTPIFVQAMEAEQPAGTPVTVLISSQSRLLQQLGLEGQVLNPKEAALLEADGSPVPAQFKLVRMPKQMGLGAQVTFKLDKLLPAGQTRQYTLQFNAQQAPDAAGLPPVNPASMGTDYATVELGHPWDFDEGAEKVFSGAWHAKVREGGGNGGYLWATADGKYSSPSLGSYTGKIDGAKYYKIVARAKRVGPTPSSILVNGKTYLRDSAGKRELKTTFDIYSADMRGRPGWGKTVDKLSFRWGYNAPTPTADDSIQIDWLRIVAPRPVLTWAGIIEGANPTASGLKVYAQWFRPNSSSAYFYVQNTGKKPVTLTKLWIDGLQESDKPWPLDDTRRTTWFDILPEHLEPGQIAQIRANLRDTVRETPVALTVQGDSGLRASAVIAPDAPPVYFSDIDFAENGKSAYLYVKGVKGELKQVLVDGQDVTAQSDLTAAKAFDGTAMVIVRPDQPFKLGSRHLFEVRTSDGAQAIYRCRTRNGQFVLGTYGNVRPEDYASHGLNLCVSFRYLTPDQLDALHAAGMYGSSVPQVGGRYDRKEKKFVPLDVEATRKQIEADAKNPGLWLFGLPDEPDGADYYTGQGVGAHARTFLKVRKLMDEINPAIPVYLQIDSTYRTKNYQVYAELADYAATHLYNLGKADPAEGWRGQMRALRLATRPQPYLWVTQFYPLHEAGKKGFNGRFPSSGEMQWQLLATLADGAKGFVHYIHSGSGGGRGGAGRDKALWDSMTALHQQVAAAGKIAARSTPVDWASTGTDKARANALLSDPKNILVVVTNRTLVSTQKEFKAPPLENVKISVKLPAWAQVDEAVEIAPGGELKPVSIRRNKGSVSFEAKQIEVGTVYWLRHKS